MSTLTLVSNVASVVENITNTTTYHGFKVSVHSLELNTSVTLKVSVAYLLNGALIPNQPNDKQYNYANRFIVLTGSDYTSWGTDDSYIVTYVENNFDKVLASTYKPKMNILQMNNEFRLQKFKN